MRVAFSTIACPNFDVADVRMAVESYGFDGVELYALRGRLLTPELLTVEETRRLVAGLGAVEIPVINSFVSLVDGEATALIRALEAAHDLASPIVKAFGGEHVDPVEKLNRARHTLEGVVPRAQELGIRIVVETHDGFARGEELARLLEPFDSTVGALWDIQNSVVAGESTLETEAAIGTRIVHAHVKDATCHDVWKPCELGEGELPLVDFVAALRRSGFAGFLSFDHEKHWHPELADPQDSLPRAAALLRALIDAPDAVVA